MTHYLRMKIILMTALLFLPCILAANEGDGPQPPPYPQPGWSAFVRGGVVHQFDTNMDNGGSYSATRFNIQAGPQYTWDFKSSMSLGIGYSHDGYDFSGDNGLAALDPWEKIHTLRLSLPVRKRFNENWSAFLVPLVCFTGEDGATFEDSLTGGGFVGVAYRFGKRLTIGPGFGVLTQIEDDPSIIPILILDWHITDRLSLGTGRGLGATPGPGLTLNYKADPNWNFQVGGRYERLRFRLDKDGRVPSGIGEDKAFLLFGGLTYSFSRSVDISLVGGVELGGELGIEDNEGNLLNKESYDPGDFLGFTFNWKF